ncbi:hypothetical protein [Pantoea agglomerans]|uniref:hypothetical protein n=1 Tax=Enterobacter agglomerans TaxID=549 RepID=UPI0015FB60DA|nr:hypothetical protein [Pantoea agglomerans]MBA8870104.1 hypothetical protein [Pantoea agglomerans]MBA8874483.1 hypothetical protein [Pantoea agglomerans]
MSKIIFDFGKHPLALSYGAIDSVKKLRAKSQKNEIAVSVVKNIGDAISKTVSVGKIGPDYHIYFMTTRPRFRLTSYPEGDFIRVNNANETKIDILSINFNIEPDPRAFNKVNSSPIQEIHKAEVRLSFSEHFKRVIRGYAGGDCEIINVCQTESFNGITFYFKDDKPSPISLRLTPDLMKFINFTNQREFISFRDYLHYEIHYIGQAKLIEDRLHDHEKTKDIMNILTTTKLDHDPVIFAYSYECDSDLDQEFLRDLVEAVLIRHFQPRHNKEMTEFPNGTRHKEKLLQDKVKRLGVTSVIINPIGHIDGFNSFNDIPCPLSLGYGYTNSNNSTLFTYSIIKSIL